MMAPNVYGSSIWNFLVTLLAFRILWWLLDLWKIFAFLLYAMDPINHPSKYCRFSWLRPFNVCNTKLANVLGVCVSKYSFRSIQLFPSKTGHFGTSVTDAASSQSQKQTLSTADLKKS
jgi:hypothetical protein